MPRSIHPPQHHCINPDCQRTQKGLALKKAEQRQAVLYTLDYGPIPRLVSPSILRKFVAFLSILITTVAHTGNVEECKVNYHSNFYVHQGRRVYYGGIPDIIQVGEHQFVERKVVELWVTLMVVSWTSATNCVRFYNAALSCNRQPPPGWHFGFTLRDSDHV